MIQEETDILIADNTGAKRARCFRVLGGTKKRYASVGDIVLCSVKEADPQGSVKKKEKVRVVIVRTKARIKRKDGSEIKYYDNSGVIIDDKNNPVGSRVFGPVAKELKDFKKICSLAKEVN